MRWGRWARTPRAQSRPRADPGPPSHVPEDPARPQDPPRDHDGHLLGPDRALQLALGMRSCSVQLLEACCPQLGRWSLRGDSDAAWGGPSGKRTTPRLSPGSLTCPGREGIPIAPRRLYHSVSPASSLTQGVSTPFGRAVRYDRGLCMNADTHTCSRTCMHTSFSVVSFGSIAPRQFLSEVQGQG